MMTLRLVRLRMPPPAFRYRYSDAREVFRVLQISSTEEVLSGVSSQEYATGCLC
jgi:hypothetical protein